MEILQTALRNFIAQAEKEISDLEALARGELNSRDRETWEEGIAEWRALVDAGQRALTSPAATRSR